MSLLSNVPVHMICDPIRAIPTHTLPPSYRFRPYQGGDEETWTRIQRAAEPYLVIEDSLFRQQFGVDEEMLAQRMAFVENADAKPVATISAWWQENWNQSGEWGQIHWVAVHPEHQRQGIAKAMMTWAMHQLLSWHGRAMLGTSTARIEAIKIYLDFGFRPSPLEVTQHDIAEAWRTLHRHLRHPVLAAALNE